MRRRSLLTGFVAAQFVPAAPYIVRAPETPGVTSSEIRIGSMAAYSGPASRIAPSAALIPPHSNGSTIRAVSVGAR
jgi:hypothetical protein